MFESMLNVQHAVLRFAADFDAAVLSGAQAASVVTVVARMKNALATVESLAAARVAACGTWRDAGAASAADWLATHTGTTTSQAKDRLDMGQALSRGLDATAARARSGELSVDKAIAIADAAALNPAAEDALLDVAANETVGSLRELCKQKKAEAESDPDATLRRIHTQRSLRRWTDAEGAAHLHWTSTPPDAAVLATALDTITDELFNAARREGRVEPPEAYTADALVELACRATTAPASNAGGAKVARVRERHLALIRVELPALARGSIEPGEVCEIADIGPIPVATARELLSDSVLKLVLTRGRDANVTHLGRGANAAQKVALLWRSPICSVEGCGRRARLENDQVDPCAHVRETSLANLEPKCDHHHDLKTYQGWDSAVGEGRRPLVPPDDARHPRHKPPPAAA